MALDELTEVNSQFGYPSTLYTLSISKPFVTLIPPFS